LTLQNDGSRVADAIAFLREAVAIAREQRARLLELQATLDLARLLKRAGATAEARSVIEAGYGGMTEGLDLPVMVESREFIASCE